MGQFVQLIKHLLVKCVDKGSSRRDTVQTTP